MSNYLTPGGRQLGSPLTIPNPSHVARAVTRTPCFQRYGKSNFVGAPGIPTVMKPFPGSPGRNWERICDAEAPRNRDGKGAKMEG